MAEFARLDIKEIRSDAPRSNFAEDKIEQIANLILESGGIIRPLIVQQVDIDSYQLVEGALEYHAAVRAREKDPRRGELVNAFVVAAKDGEMVKQQLALFHENGIRPAVTPVETATAPDQLTTFLTNFVVSSEARIHEMREKLFQAERKFDADLSRVEKLVEKERRLSDLLDLINTLSADELRAQLSFYGANKKQVEAICNARRQKGSGTFASYQDLLAATKNSGTKGLGEKGLLTLIDHVRMYNNSR